jgi:hypothetical protein
MYKNKLPDQTQVTSIFMKNEGGFKQEKLPKCCIFATVYT